MATTTVQSHQSVWYQEVTPSASTNYGNGSGPRLQCGFGDGSTDWINRFSVTWDLAAVLSAINSDPAKLTAAVLRLRVRGTNSCWSQGSAPKFWLERTSNADDTGTANSESGECSGATTGGAAARFPGPTRTTTNRIKYEGTPTAGNWIEITLNVQQVRDWISASRAGTLFTLVAIAADASTGYAESSTSRKIAFYSHNTTSKPELVLTYSTNSAPSAPSTNLLPSGTITPVDLGGGVQGFVAEGNFSDVDTADTCSFVDTVFATTNSIDSNGKLNSGVVYDSGLVAPTTYNGTTKRWTRNVPLTSGTGFSRGTTYYYVYRVQDSAGNNSGWSTVRSFTIAAVITATKTNPTASQFAYIWNLGEAVLWTATGSHAKPRFAWTTSQTQSAYRVRIYSASSGGSLLHDSGKVTSANLFYLANYAMLNKDQASSERWWTIEVWNSLDESSGESSRTGFKVCWGQGIYEHNPGAGSSSYQFTAGSVPTNTEATFLFRSATGSGGAGAGALKTTIAEVPSSAWINVIVRLSTQVVGTNTALPSMTFSYAGSSSAPDHWTREPAGDWTLDPSAYRFGTKGLKCVVSANTGNRYVYPFRFVAGDDIVVVPGQTYTFSAFVRTAAALSAGAKLRLAVYAAGSTSDVRKVGTTDGIDSVTDTAGAWKRLSMQYTAAPGESLVRPMIHYLNGGAGSGDTFWADAAKWEEGSVATAWAPGWLSPAVVVDSYGIMLDASGGASFRIRGTGGGATDTVQPGEHTLLFGGPLEVVEQSSDPATSPPSGQVKLYSKSGRLYRKDSSGSVSEVLVSQVENANANDGTYAVRVKKTADGQYRLEAGLSSDGSPMILMGGGASARDLRLRRTGAGGAVLDANSIGTTLTLSMEASDFYNAFFQLKRASEAQPRLRLRGGDDAGSVEWGPGGNIQPTTRIRYSGSNALTLDTLSGGQASLTVTGLLTGKVSGCIAGANATQSVTTDTDTALAFNTEERDTDAYHDNATNNTRFTAPFTGYYDMGCSYAIGTGTTGARNLWIQRYNSDGTGATELARVNDTALNPTRQSIHRTIYLTAGQYIEFIVRHNQGSSQTVEATRHAWITFRGS